MKRADPYSTPARRRRIINDVAKSVLRTYAIAACNNVIKFRKETKASIVLQCRIRGFIAKCKLRKLIFARRTKAATKIQDIWRMKLARLLKVRLRKALRLKQATTLALYVQTLYRNRKERLHRIALMIARRLALEKKRLLSAIHIQRVFRGVLGRRRFGEFVAARKALHLKRKLATIKIQSTMRRCLAVVNVSVRRSKRKIEFKRLCLKFHRWKRYRVLQLRKCIICQSVVRMFLAKRKVAAYRALIAQMRLDKMSECRPLSPYHIPVRRDPNPTKTMNIQVDLSLDLLSQMVTLGPRSVIAWSVDNYILHYNVSAGYTLGAVVQQVVTSVDSLLTANENKEHSDTHSATDNLVTLDKWEEGHSSDTPLTKHLPAGWSKSCTGRDGATLSVVLCSDKIELHVTLDNPLPNTVVQESGSVPYSIDDGSKGLLFDFYSKIDVPPVVTSSLIVIVLHSESNILEGESSVLSNLNLLSLRNDTINEYKSVVSSVVDMKQEGSTKHAGINEAKFRFKNALVQVTTGPPVTVEEVPLSPPHPIALPSDVIIFDDELSDDDDDIDLLIDKHLEESPPAPSLRPHTATVVRIVLKDPTPPPIDFDHMARRIQFMLRRRLDLLNVAAEYIQAMFYHFLMQHKWQSLVQQVLLRAITASMRIQRMIRCQQARKKLFDLRSSYRYCPDFSLDEEVNWRSFGMLPANSVSSYVPPPQVIVKDSLSSSPSKRLHTSTTPVGQLLDLLQLPPPPPGCILAYDPLVRLSAVTNDKIDTDEAYDCFHHLKSDNAAVRHLVLKNSLFQSDLNISSSDVESLKQSVDKFVSKMGQKPLDSTALEANLFGNVFINDRPAVSSSWNNEFNEVEAKSNKNRVAIAPAYVRIAEAYK